MLRPERPIADMSPSEVRALIPVAGPVFADTPESVRLALEDEIVIEQTAMFDDWLKAGVWLCGMLAVSLSIVVILMFLGFSIYSRIRG